MTRLRCLVGAYAGRVLDYPDAVAEQLLANGRAERVDDNVPARSESETAVLPRAEQRWRLKVSPAAYLSRHPDGKSAALARQLVEQEGADG